MYDMAIAKYSYYYKLVLLNVSFYPVRHSFRNSHDYHNNIINNDNN